MVRKKRRALLKDAPVATSTTSNSTTAGTSNSSSSSSAQPARVALERVLLQPPVDAQLPFVLGTADAPSAPPLHSLSEWLAHLSGAASLFDQLRVLQLFRSKLAKAEALPATFVAAAWRLLFRVYVAPPADALRKNVFLVLDALTRSDAAEAVGGALQQAAADELRFFLDRLCQEHAAPETPEQSVHALDLLLLVAEFPFLARVLVTDGADADAPQDVYLLRFVRFCADQLAFLAEPIVDYSISSSAGGSGSGSSTASTNVVLLASERCGHALKNSILLCTMKEFLYARLHKIEVRHGAAGLDHATRDFLRILGHCVLILQTSVAHKDLLTQAGLAYCLVLRLLLQAPAAAQAAQVTSLMLRAMYPEKTLLAPSAAVASPLLRIHLDSDMASFGEFSRLAVYRGMLSGLSDDELVAPFAASASDRRSVLEVLFTSVQEFCQEEALNTRLYAFQVLETILRRAVAISQRQHKKQERASPTGGEQLNTAAASPISPQTLVALTAQILLNWEHPSKRVNQFMAQMFVHVVSYFALSADFESWKRDIVRRLVEHPQHSRAKYGALAILLAEYGARELLREHPSLLESVLLAVGHTDVSAAAAGLFAQILDDLHAQGSAKNKKNKKSENGHEAAAVHEWRLLWIDNVVRVLLSKQASMRSQVAMYVIPLLVKKDPDCVPLLVEKLRAAAGNGSTANNKKTKQQQQTPAAAADANTCLWAIIEILKLARKRLSPEKLLGLSTAEIEDGLSHAKAETRSAAFDAICASLKSTTMPSAHELELIQKYLALHGKEISPTSRLNVMIGLKNVFLRVKANLHASSRAAPAAGVDVQRKQREDVELAQGFKRWVELFIVTSIYSGAIPQRQILGLNVLQLYVQVFGLRDEHDEAGASSLLLTPHMVTTLLNMLASAWDVIRSLAYSILDLYPDELPGFTSAKELTLLLKWSMALCVSARQRESDAGGLFMRLLFKKSAAIVQHGIEFQASASSAAKQSAAMQSPQAAFVLKLADVILTRLSDAASGDKARRGELPLVHGLLLSLRYIVEIVDFEALSQSSEAVSEWRVAMDHVFQCIRQAMRYSLFVVGDATAGVGDEELSEAFSSAVVVGEVNSLPKTDAIPLRVDCRGHLILEDGEIGDDENDTEQRAVVGSWLAARECGSILDVLMRRVPAPRLDSTQPVFFTTETAKQGGEMLLNSLFELKHKGAVATAYQAFEGVCRSFLANGEKNAAIGSLPQVWADRLLDRLERSEQHFILRRSSGFAFSFVAILRSEPRNSAAVILPKVMANLLRLAGLDTDALSAAGSQQQQQQQQQHLLWRSRVHALNILKLICQDAILADDVSVYVAEMLELAVFGFDCSSWAVRNSSMMLFAATTQRALGDKRIADGASNVKVASVDVFSRFQQLNGFIYRELVKCTAQTSATTPPPGLYPILMFMSRLKPGDDDTSDATPSAEHQPLAAFVPLVRKCAAQPTMAIRQMAAKVLATITRDEDAVALLQELTAQLPNGVRSASATAGGTVEQPRMTSNVVHGVLLQIQHLVAKYLDVESAAQESGDDRRSQAVRQIVHHVASELFVSKMWLWTSEQLASGVLRAAFLGIVDSFVAFCYAKGVSVLTDDVEHILGVIQTQCAKDLQERCPSELQVASAPSQRAAAPSAPGQYVADRALVSIFFSVWKFRKVQWLRKTENAPGGVLPLVEHMLQSFVLEVRKKATKQLANAIRGDVHFALKLSDKAYESLRTVLAEQLLVETHPKVKARQLALLVHCQTAHDAPLPSTMRDAVQAELLEILEQSADAEVLAPALELLALTVRQDKYASEGACTQLKQEIVARSSELQSLALRHAAARALGHSGFLVLQTDTEWKTEVAVDSWLSALKLLQDDDVSTRALVRDAVQIALVPSSSAPPRATSDTRVLPQAIAYVVERFVHTAYGAAAVSRTFLALIDAPSVLKEYTSDAGARGQDWGDLCDRIFEAESSNFFAEPDLAAQLFVYHLFASEAAAALQQRPRSNSSGLFGFGGSSAAGSTAASIVASEALAGLRRQVLERVEDALTQLSAEDAREQWIGGITYYSSVFASLLSLLTAGAAVVRLRKHLNGAAEKKSVAHIASLARVCVERFESLHPLLKTALELLSSAAMPPAASSSSSASVTTSRELGAGGDTSIASLLYLTPYWKALN